MASSIKRFFIEVEEGDSDEVILKKIKQSKNSQEKEDCKKFEEYLSGLDKQIHDNKGFYIENVVHMIESKVLEQVEKLHNDYYEYRLEIVQELNRYNKKSQNYIQKHIDIFEELDGLETRESTLAFLVETATDKVIERMKNGTT